jgi:poly-gamma-glutamate capsule biosynthesis protein CapA/YwtB (metallophosphatase superfamily)
MTAGRSTSELSIAWLGDTLIGDASQPYIDQFGPDWVAERLPALDADLVVANLEGPITTRTEPADPDQRWSYETSPAVAPLLRRLGVDVVSLANNHAMDRGSFGLADTVKNLTDAGVRSIGAGPTSGESRLPLMVKSPMGIVAIVAFADIEIGSGRYDPGVRRLTRENLRLGVELARRGGAARVAAFVHWGENYEAVNASQRTWAESFRDAGYDLVVGTGPHIAQPIDVVGGMPVAYSIGNFVMGTPGRFAKRGTHGYGIVLTTTLAKNGDITLSMRCIVTDNQLTNYQPGPCTSEEAATMLRALHPAVRIEGDAGTMTVLAVSSPA